MCVVMKQNGAGVKPLQVPSPYSGAATPAALNGTLSPLSPHLIPSPAGSVSSVGSAVRSTLLYVGLSLLTAVSGQRWHYGECRIITMISCFLHFVVVML